MVNKIHQKRLVTKSKSDWKKIQTKHKYSSLSTKVGTKRKKMSRSRNEHAMEQK